MFKHILKISILEYINQFKEMKMEILDIQQINSYRKDMRDIVADAYHARDNDSYSEAQKDGQDLINALIEKIKELESKLCN